MEILDIEGARNCLYNESAEKILIFNIFYFHFSSLKKGALFTAVERLSIYAATWKYLIRKQCFCIVADWQHVVPGYCTNINPYLMNRQRNVSCLCTTHSSHSTHNLQTTTPSHLIHTLRFYCTNKSNPSNQNITTTTTATITSASDNFLNTITTSAPSPNTIDEFRAREEKREQEFAQQQASQDSKQKNDSEEESKRHKVEAIRRKILCAALEHVPTLGWTRNAIIQGAEDVGMPSVVHGMFPEGGFALVSFFNGRCNERLLEKLQKETQDSRRSEMDHVDFLVGAVRARLELLIPYKDHWPQAMALIAAPQNASTALAQVLTLVDDICYFAGDRSVDIGWYTRRIGLATIMKMTELYMLQDKSPDHANTWEFLKNRMDEAVQLQMMLSQSEDMTHRLQRSFNSAFITARNILGLGYNR